MHKQSRTIRRRRQEAKTDYGARLALLKSGKTRLVVRKTNRYIIAQLVGSNIAQDFIISGVTSRDLLDNGWPKDGLGSLKSKAAAYLTGLLLGIKAKAKVKEAILDFGMHRNNSKSRIYAVVKGVIDSGIKIPCSSDYLPSVEELKGNEKISSIFDKLKQKIGEE